MLHSGIITTKVGTVRLTTTAGTPDLPLPHRSTSVQFEFKRVIDIVLSLSAIVVLSPFLAALWALVRTTSNGPALIRQKRYGKGGSTFNVLKFRSMYVDMGDETGTVQAKPNDPRISPFGSFLRRTSLDELPQLFNVLMGEMSLVGPRPHPIGMQAAGELYEDLVPYYHLRHTVRPGITGLAQVNGYRGGTSDVNRARTRIEFDLAYIQNFSLWLDFKIIVMTLIGEFLRGTGE